MKIIRLIVFLTFALYTSLANAQNFGKPYYPKLTAVSLDMNAVKADIDKQLTNGILIYYQKLSAKPKKILVLDDRIEFKLTNQNMIFYFSDIPLDQNIEAHESASVKNENGSVTTSWSDLRFGNIIFSCNYNEPIMRLADDFFFIQCHLNAKRYSSQLPLFEPIAAQYRVLKIKPVVSEGQREYIVQANLFTQKKEYNKAIELYIKVIELDPTAYSSAYSNLALLSAQVGKFDAAIYYMKKYLLLEPAATDARSAQDKIYEWKAQSAN